MGKILYSSTWELCGVIIIDDLFPIITVAMGDHRSGIPWDSGDTLVTWLALDSGNIDRLFRYG